MQNITIKLEDPVTDEQRKLLETLQGLASKEVIPVGHLQGLISLYVKQPPGDLIEFYAYKEAHVVDTHIVDASAATEATQNDAGPLPDANPKSTFEKSFIGNHPVQTESYVISQPPGSQKPGFYAYERIGLDVMRGTKGHDGKYDIKSLKPISERDGLKPGDMVIVDTPFGYVEFKVNATMDTLESDALMSTLSYDKGVPDAGIPPCWTATGFVNMSALSRVDFK